VGGGPGDLGVVTLRAKELLERADVIVYDALANPEMLGWARVDAEIIFAGKRAGEKTLSQDEINALLIEKSRSGKNVVRLKGGDPFGWRRSPAKCWRTAAERTCRWPSSVSARWDIKKPLLVLSKISQSERVQRASKRQLSQFSVMSFPCEKI